MRRVAGSVSCLTSPVRPVGQYVAARGARLLHSEVDSDAQNQAAKTWTPVVDPFTSAMQSRAEQELLDQVLKEADAQEQAEDAAEQVSRSLNAAKNLVAKTSSPHV